MTYRALVAALLAALPVFGCTDKKPGTKQTIGTLGGAAVGGLLGWRYPLFEALSCGRDRVRWP